VLHRAVLSGHEDVVQILLEAGADVNAMSDDYGTPLCLAALKGVDDTVKILLGYRAKADVTTKKVGAPLHCCILSLGEHTTTITALIHAGARLTTQATVDTRWLHVICGWDGDDRTRMSSPQHVDGCILYDATPAFVAVRSFRDDLLETLLPADKSDLNHAFQIDFQEAAAGSNSKSTKPRIREVQALEDEFDGFKSLRHTYLSSCATNGDLGGMKLLIAKRAKLDLDHKTIVVPLMTAAVEGHTKIVSLLLGSGASVDETGSDGSTALHCAAISGTPTIVRLLCERGAKPDTADDEGYTALHYAASRDETTTDGHRQVVGILCEHGATVDAQTNDGTTALNFAARQGLYEIVCLLCERGAMVNIQDQDGLTSLNQALRQSNYEVVRLLCERGATVDIKSNTGQTALHFAAICPNHRAVQTLCERGAMVDARDISGNTPLWYAADRHSNRDLTCCNDAWHPLRMLVDAGADINARNSLGQTPLLAMLMMHNVVDLAVLDKLVRAGAETSARDQEGLSVLRLCFGKPFAKAVITTIGKALAFEDATNDRVYAQLESLCRIWDFPAQHEQNLVYHAAKGGREDLRLVLALGADIDIEDEEAGTAMHLAALWNAVVAIDRLLAAGASLELLDFKGRTPLAVAVQNKRTEAVRGLIRHGSNPRARGTGTGAQTALEIAKGQRDRRMLSILK
jgi:ankyrin repeat protein